MTVSDEQVYYTRFPPALMPNEPQIEAVSEEFDSTLPTDAKSDRLPFVDRLVAHTVHGLPESTVKQVLAHKVNDKYLTVGAGSDLKKKPFEGPKRSKYRKSMSSRQRKANGFDVLSTDHENYELYLPLHDLWRQYMDNLLTGTRADKSGRLTRADWHGAVIQVIKSQSPGLVGLTGIVLQETTNTFKIITAENKYKTLPKAHTVFTMKVGDNTVATLYGNHILYKPADRSIRKFKAKQTIDIGV